MIGTNKVVPVGERDDPIQSGQRSAWTEEKIHPADDTNCDNNLILDSQFGENYENSPVVNSNSLDLDVGISLLRNSNESFLSSNDRVQSSRVSSENSIYVSAENVNEKSAAVGTTSENLSLIDVQCSNENIIVIDAPGSGGEEDVVQENFERSSANCHPTTTTNVNSVPLSENHDEIDKSTHIFSISIDDDKDKIDDALLPCTTLLIEHKATVKIDDQRKSPKKRSSSRNVTKKKKKQTKAERSSKNVKHIFLLCCECSPWSIPWVILVISSLQIFIYFLHNDYIYNLFIFAPMKMNEIWRFITYTFLHAGSVHLFLNVLIQIMISFPLETEQGPLRVLLVYFGGVLCGSLGASIFEKFLMVGASAGVYSLLMSHIPHIVINFSTLSHRYFRLISVLVLCSSDVIYSIKHCLMKGNSEPKIGVVAHLSGAIAGLFLGFILYKSPSKLKVYKVIKFISLFLYTVWIATSILFNCNQNLFNL